VAILDEQCEVHDVTAANTLEQLVTNLDGVDPVRCLTAASECNAEATSTLEFGRVIKDGRSTVTRALPNSNWVNPIDQPPFEAVAIACGVTFTFGGLGTSTGAEVINTDGEVVPRPYACNGLAWGSAMDGIAGRQAVEAVVAQPVS
jgi:tricarballylate dehydrogenase